MLKIVLAVAQGNLIWHRYANGRGHPSKDGEGTGGASSHWAHRGG